MKTLFDRPPCCPACGRPLTPSALGGGICSGCGQLISRRIDEARSAAAPSPMVEGPYSARFHHTSRGEIPAVPDGRGGCRAREGTAA